MISTSITISLARLRRRERLLALTWGAAQWLAVVLAALLFACLVDWLIDRERDTPWSVRRLLLAMHVMIAGTAGWWFIVRPLWRRLDDDELALWVEAKQPALAHRLISAVQLTRPGAKTAGMSAELIAIVHGEAEQRSASLDFPQVADHGRLRWSGQLLAPIGVVILLPLILAPQLAAVLLARQFLADVDVPRSVSIEPLKLDDVLPAGEKFALQFRVRGLEVDPEWTGAVYVTPQGQPRDRYPLEFARYDGTDAIFEAKPAPSTRNFTFTARLQDGRMRRPGHVAMVPRPVVTEQHAFLQLPEFCGTKPSGGRYELGQGRGDVVGIPGSSARIAIKTQHPVRKVLIQLEKSVPTDSTDKTTETVVREVPMTLNESGDKAEGSFDLKADETGYRIVATDQYGFVNVPAPRRTVRLVSEEPPQVTLLKEQMPPAGPITSDASWGAFEVDGLPIVPGKKIRVGYVAHGPYGLGRARFLYRIVRKTESGNEEMKEEPWRFIDLVPTEASAKSGNFDARRGVFVNSPSEATVYFHAAPSPDPELILGRTLGGGRFDFETSGISDGKGGLVTLRVGDHLEFCVEVFADEKESAKRPSARSEVRVRPIVSEADFGRWFVDAVQEEQRLRDLAEKQGVVFGQR